MSLPILSAYRANSSKFTSKMLFLGYFGHFDRRSLVKKYDLT